MHRCFRLALLCALVLIWPVAAVAAEAELVFGPKQFVIEAGKPPVFDERFALTPSDQRCLGDAAYVLIIQNGDGSGRNAVSSATISVNGVGVLREKDFSANRVRMEVPLVLQPSNTLSLTLKGGKPGSFVVLSVRREIDQILQPPQTLVLSKGVGSLQASYSIGDPESAFALIVANGNSTGEQRVASGSIVLNGKTVIGEKELHRAAGLLRVRIDLEAENSLVVDARGESGAMVRVALARLLDANACGPRVLFSSPSERAVVADSSILVTGTAVGAPNLGISVNGQAAEVDPSHAGTPDDPFAWTAVIGATPGPVTLRAIATDANGAETQASREIVFSPRPGRLLLLPSHSSGPAPLTVLFNVRVDLDEPVVLYELDLDGDGAFESSSAEIPDRPTFTYEQPGTRTATLRIRMQDGSARSTSTPIVVQSFFALNKLIQLQWSRFADSLAATDIGAALAQLADDSTRRKYADAFRLIQSSLPRFAAGIRTIKPVWITGKAAHYLMTRLEDGQLHAYHVYFVRDASGVWKVAQF